MAILNEKIVISAQDNATRVIVAAYANMTKSAENAARGTAAFNKMMVSHMHTSIATNNTAWVSMEQGASSASNVIGNKLARSVGNAALQFGGMEAQANSSLRVLGAFGLQGAAAAAAIGILIGAYKLLIEQINKKSQIELKEWEEGIASNKGVYAAELMVYDLRKKNLPLTEEEIELKKWQLRLAAYIAEKEKELEAYNKNRIKYSDQIVTANIELDKLYKNQMNAGKDLLDLEEKRSYRMQEIKKLQGDIIKSSKAEMDISYMFKVPEKKKDNPEWQSAIKLYMDYYRKEAGAEKTSAPTSVVDTIKTDADFKAANDAFNAYRIQSGQITERDLLQQKMGSLEQLRVMEKEYWDTKTALAKIDIDTEMKLQATRLSNTQIIFSSLSMMGNEWQSNELKAIGAVGEQVVSLALLWQALGGMKEIGKWGLPGIAFAAAVVAGTATVISQMKGIYGTMNKGAAAGNISAPSTPAYSGYSGGSSGGETNYVTINGIVTNEVWRIIARTSLSKAFRQEALRGA